MTFKAKTKRQQVYTQINDDIILIHQDSMTSMNFNTCNCYLIKVNEKDYAVIDPGCSRKKMKGILKKKDINFSNLKYVF